MTTATERPSRHTVEMGTPIEEAIHRKGFRFIEVIAPCPTLYSRRNRLGNGVEQLKYYKENSVLKHGAPTAELDIGYQGEIAVGKFVDRERPTWLDAMNGHHAKVIGEQYRPWGVR